MAFYSVKTWTLLSGNTKKLEAFEMWLWRRMQRISWAERLIDETIDGSTDRRCFAIVTNERALLSRLDQPVRKV